MLIDYQKENVITLPITNEHRALEKTVMLSPGINEVPKKDWDKCATLPKVKRLITDDKIKIVVAADDTEKEFAISKLNTKEAAAVIKRTWNLILLDDWKAGESRPGVVKAINIQIKLVEDKTRPKKKAANE